MAGHDATGAIGAIGKVKHNDGHNVGASLAYTPQQEPPKIFGDDKVHLNHHQKNVSVFS